MSRIAPLIAVVLAAGCASPDYSHARRTRNERPYAGGAAAVPDKRLAERDESPETVLDVLGFFAALGLMQSNDVDHSRGRASDYEPPLQGR